MKFTHIIQELVDCTCNKHILFLNQLKTVGNNGRKRRKESPASRGIETHDIQIMRRVFYRCATSLVHTQQSGISSSIGKAVTEPQTLPDMRKLYQPYYRSYDLMHHLASITTQTRPVRPKTHEIIQSTVKGARQHPGTCLPPQKVFCHILGLELVLGDLVALEQLLSLLAVWHSGLVHLRVVSIFMNHTGYIFDSCSAQWNMEK